MAREMSFKWFYKSHHSLLRMFLLDVSPEDFVVLKIDIDGGLEIQILLEITNYPKVSELVDYIFIKYNFGWGFDVNPGYKVDDALVILTKLCRLLIFSNLRYISITSFIVGHLGQSFITTARFPDACINHAKRICCSINSLCIKH